MVVWASATGWRCRAPLMPWCREGMSGTLGARGPSRLVQMISDLFLGRFGGLNFALAQWAGGQFLGGQFFDG